MKLRNLRPLAIVVIIMVIIHATLLPIFQLILFLRPPMPEDLYWMGSYTLGMLGWRIVTSIVFSIRIHRAGRNLIDAGLEDLEFSPGSRIWWFLVPIACLYKPYQGMRELWNASYGQDYLENNSLLATWWALWLAGAFSGVLVLLLGPGSSWVVSTVIVGTAFTAILIVRGITEAQTHLSGESMAEVFA